MLTACAIAACIALGEARAQAAASESVVVTGKRDNRVSSGATGMSMEIKDTPQSISTVDQQDLADFGLTGSIDALRLGTGINVEQYETNRSVFNARGFEVQFTQVDGLGLSNSWGTVVGQMDSFLFDRIEFIRGANGLLTGMGNAS
ncbi:MAG TPA: TonB-dependent receptor plug domain-containing protein, partial [Ideonella sp.]|nr:TonB-dependent receptor plug domain-containing protein [Ideonella sp.]